MVLSALEDLRIFKLWSIGVTAQCRLRALWMMWECEKNALRASWSMTWIRRSLQRVSTCKQPTLYPASPQTLVTLAQISPVPDSLLWSRIVSFRLSWWWEILILLWLSVRISLKVMALKSQCWKWIASWLLATYWADLSVSCRLPSEWICNPISTRVNDPPHTQVELSVCSGLLVTFVNGLGVLLVPTARGHHIWGKGCPLPCGWS